jgi:hypothetical protein
VFGPYAGQVLASYLEQPVAEGMAHLDGQLAALHGALEPIMAAITVGMSLHMYVCVCIVCVCVSGAGADATGSGDPEDGWEAGGRAPRERVAKGGLQGNPMRTPLLAHAGTRRLLAPGLPPCSPTRPRSHPSRTAASIRSETEPP